MGKTALKLLLVFVEYTESNSRVLYSAIQTVDSNQGMTKKGETYMYLHRYMYKFTPLAHISQQSDSNYSG